MSEEGRRKEQTGRGPGEEAGFVVFGGGNGRAGGGCLFWILISVALSVGLTILVNLVLLLFSGPAPGVNV